MTVQQHKKRIHQLPCIVCFKMGMEQSTPTVLHHPESIRDENADFGGVALCDEHHKLLHAMSRRSFHTLTKLTEFDMLALTIRMMDREGMMRG